MPAGRPRPGTGQAERRELDHGGPHTDGPAHERVGRPRDAGRRGIAAIPAAALAAASISTLGVASAPPAPAVPGKANKLGHPRRRGAGRHRAEEGLHAVRQGQEQPEDQDRRHRPDRRHGLRRDRRSPTGPSPGSTTTPSSPSTSSSTKTGERQVEGTVERRPDLEPCPEALRERVVRAGQRQRRDRRRARHRLRHQVRAALRRRGVQGREDEEGAQEAPEKATKNCNFTLVDGKLKLTALNKVVDIARGQEIDDHRRRRRATPRPSPPDILFTDKWILRNLDADSDGRESPKPSGTPDRRRPQARPDRGLVAGHPDGHRQTAASATSAAPLTRTYTFTGDCNGGSAARSR